MIAILFYRQFFCSINVANIFELPSKDGNITPEKARQIATNAFFTAKEYVWGLRYRWDPLLSMNPVRRFAHFMPPWCDLSLKLLKLHRFRSNLTKRTQITDIDVIWLFHQGWKSRDSSAIHRWIGHTIFGPKIRLWIFFTNFMSRGDELSHNSPNF